MKAIVLRKNLKDGLSMVEKAISESGNLPILKYVLLCFANNKIKLVATNLELAITTYVSGKIIEDGSIAVPFSAFNSIITNTNNERIELEVKNGNLVVRLDNYEAKIQGLPESDFPIIPRIENVNEFIELNSDILVDSLNKVQFATQISEIRPELSGVLLDAEINLLKFVATDSFRLSEKKIKDDQFSTEGHSTLRASDPMGGSSFGGKSSSILPWKIIIPLKTSHEASRIFNNSSSLRIYKDTNQVLFKTENTELISRLIDGTYPDYEQIIPKDSETELIIERDSLIQAVKLVSSFSGKINDIHLKLKGDKTLEVYAVNQFLGENNYLIPIKLKGKEFTDIVFNWRYLLDGLKVLSGKDIILNLNGEVRPAMLQSVEDKSLLYIAMPIKSS